jgi:hypothetical protein
MSLLDININDELSVEVLKPKLIRWLNKNFSRRVWDDINIISHVELSKPFFKFTYLGEVIRGNKLVLASRPELMSDLPKYILITNPHEYRHNLCTLDVIIKDIYEEF